MTMEPHVLDEANRCLECKKPSCQKGCPISTPIPTVIKLLKGNKLDEAGYTSRPGVFASGDVVNGSRTVVEAVAHSKVVAETMHRYIESLPDEG